MILPRLPQGLVYQLVSFGGIALKSGKIFEALRIHLVKPQAVSENLVLLFQHLEPSGLVLAVIGGPVDQLLALQSHSAAC